MVTLTELLAGAVAEGEGFAYSLTEDWMQGRAVYGGLSAALCLDACLRAMPDLPPLRSANINFIGPASEQVRVSCKVLRRGKSVAFVEAVLSGDSGPITAAVFSFGAAREVSVDRMILPNRAPLNPDDYPSMHPPGAPRPNFTQHFDARVVAGELPFSGAAEGNIELLVKHADAAASGVVALTALADVPPPAVIVMGSQPAPLSSMSWMFNVLSEDLDNASGWWLLGTYAEHARGGYSSQNMTIHNERGELVLVGRQNVTYFF